MRVIGQPTRATPPSHRRRRHRWVRGERAAAAVEFALVLPLLLVVVFGMIDFGLVIADTQAVRSGTSAATRRAAVGDFGADSSCTLTGAVASTQTHQLMCSVKSSVNLSDDDTRVKILVPTSYTVGESLFVCTQYPASSRTGFFTTLLDNRTLTSKTEIRIEVENASALSSAEETNINSEPWTWCQ